MITGEYNLKRWLEDGEEYGKNIEVIENIVRRSDIKDKMKTITLIILDILGRSISFFSLLILNFKE